MAIPESKTELKQWCKRKLGYPVIDINVDDDQIDDRLDEALQYFYTFQYDGMQRTYLKHMVTEDDIQTAYDNEIEFVPNDKIHMGSGQDGEESPNTSRNVAWEVGKGYIKVPKSVQSVLRVLPSSSFGNMNMFDFRYQMRLNDLWDFSSASVIQYQMLMLHLDMLDMILVGEKPIEFNVNQGRLYINMDWKNDINIGEYIIIECYRKLDPTVWTDIYDNLWLKKYSTALIKKQWGENLIKFNGVTMLGGVTMNGEMIYNEAKEDIERLEEESKLTWEEPLFFDIG